MNNRMSLWVSMLTAPDHGRQDAKGRSGKCVLPRASFRAKRRGERALPQRIPSNLGKTGTPWAVAD
jgi:hypothetical protein